MQKRLAIDTTLITAGMALAGTGRQASTIATRGMEVHSPY